MSTWKGIVGRGFTASLFDDYVRDLVISDWKASFVVLHNTSEPRLADWHKVSGEQRMQNLQEYYRNPDPSVHKAAWSAGPHLFVADDLIWVFTPLTTSGVHSPSWNAISWGVEMVGEYDEEPFGEQVRNNTIAALASLHAKLGFDPRGLRFHKEDPKTTHRDCPGKYVSKSDIIARVTDRVPIPHAGEHPPPNNGGNVAIGQLILQSVALKADPVLESIAARSSTLRRIVGSNAVRDGVGPLQDALNVLASSDTSLLKIELGDNSANRGIFGPLTEEAVRRFQEINALPITGIVDAPTLATIDLTLAKLADNTVGALDLPETDVVPSRTTNNAPVSIITDNADPIAYLKERVRKVYTTVPVYKLPNRIGYYFRANMAIDVDGSPRAYYPGNGSSDALDTINDADSEGSSTTYVQGEVRYGQLGVGPKNGFYVSGTSLRLDAPWRCDNFVDAEAIPYIVFPQNFKDVLLGDIAIVVNLQNSQWTHAIFADTNRYVGEASIKTARNLGRADLNAQNGDDDDNYVYILFPGSKFKPQERPPHWPDESIKTIATTLFQNWGGVAQVQKLFPHF
jgi:peptidoglycan hydrolase-like protein with peptidoglycan-binding domain